MQPSEKSDETSEFITIIPKCREAKSIVNLCVMSPRLLLLAAGLPRKVLVL